MNLNFSMQTSNDKFIIRHFYRVLIILCLESRQLFILLCTFIEVINDARVTQVSINDKNICIRIQSNVWKRLLLLNRLKKIILSVFQKENFHCLLPITCYHYLPTIFWHCEFDSYLFIKQYALLFHPILFHLCEIKPASLFFQSQNNIILTWAGFYSMYFASSCREAPSKRIYAFVRIVVGNITVHVPKHY